MATDVKLSIGTYNFDPVPAQISLGNQINRTQSGKNISTSNTGAITGVLTNLTKGAAGLSNLIALKDDMELKLLGCDTAQFMVLCCNDTVLFSNYVRITSLTFDSSSDNWTTTIPFSINIEWNYHDNNCNPCLISISDTIEISPILEIAAYSIPGPSGCSDLTSWYTVSRQLSAQGVECIVPSGEILCPSGSTPTIPSGITTPGWQVAKEWVLSQADCIPSIDQSGIAVHINVSGLSFFNHSRVKSYSCSDGTFSLSETWTMADNPNAPDYTDNFTIDVQSSNADVNKTYSIAGTINGFETRNCAAGSWKITKTKMEAANTALSLITSGSSIVEKINCFTSPDCPINTSPISSSITRAPGAGTINYAYTYTDKPQLISGSLSESLSIDENIPSFQVSEVFVLGKAQAIIQSCNKLTSRQKSVNFSAVLPRSACVDPSGCNNINSFAMAYSTFPNLDSVLCCIEGNLSDNYDRVYKVSDTKNFDPYTSVYNRSVTWTYQDCNEIFPSGVC